MTKKEFWPWLFLTLALYGAYWIGETAGIKHQLKIEDCAMVGTTIAGNTLLACDVRR